MLMIGGLHSNQQHWAVRGRGDQRTRGRLNHARGDGEPAEIASGERVVATSSSQHQWRAGNHRDGRADRATSQINQPRAIMCVSVLVMGISEDYFSTRHGGRD
ncbi:hypothetical protein ACQJBY_021578 [Aegilops geniculata]